MKKKISLSRRRIEELERQGAEDKRADEMSRESEARYRRISDLTHYLYSVRVENGRAVETTQSQACEKVTGYTTAEFAADPGLWIQMVAPEDSKWVEERFQQILAGREVPRIEYRILRKDGEMRWVSDTTTLFKDTFGNLLSYDVEIEDIAERKQVEEALRGSEKRYQKLFESMSSGFALHEVILDESGKPLDYRFLDVNPAFEKLTGWKAADLIGRAVLDVLPDTEIFWTETYGRVAATGEQFCFENYSKKLDKYLEVTVYEPEPGRYASIFQDITDRKRAEEENRTLAERLQHADKMEAIGTLAGGIAHDFNNLLMGILGYTSLSLMNLDPSHPNYERLKRIEEQVQSGADLTRQLLGFARGVRYEVKPADMNDILEKSSSMFERTRKEISIQRKYGKDLRTVEVDRGQMEQVFMNLYVNAWQAMPGGGKLYLETEDVLLNDEQAVSYSVRSGEYVKISVTDTGMGMDEKTRERIFEPFFTTKEMGRGTGLGLATVYGIIKGHKGTINVYSEPGHGTTFTIYLPVSDKEVARETMETETIARGMETILLVDDEKMVLEVNKELLESMGYLVYGVGSGQEAIAVYREKEKEIDLVILDMIMPGMSGGETFDRLREINPEIKVLLSSGYSITGKAQAIMDRGCNGFLQKPFQIEKFSRKVREMLG